MEFEKKTTYTAKECANVRFLRKYKNILSGNANQNGKTVFFKFRKVKNGKLKHYIKLNSYFSRKYL